MSGLRALYDNVQSDKNPVDEDYANALASDLAYKVLKDEYRKSYKWYVDNRLVPEDRRQYI